MIGSRSGVSVQLAQLRQLTLRELGVRFVFGAGVSVGAGLLGRFVGSRPAGVFLAFPAILLATLTLIAEEEGLTEARDEARGATLGAAALLVFAALTAWLVVRHGAPVALTAAGVCWLLAGLAGYGLIWLLGCGADEKPAHRGRG